MKVERGSETQFARFPCQGQYRDIQPIKIRHISALRNDIN